MIEPNLTLFIRFVLTLAIGLSVGAEREISRLHKKNRQAMGIRSTTLLCILGFLCGELHQIGVGFIIPCGLLVACAIVIFNQMQKNRLNSYGWTGSVTCLLCFLLGVLMALGVLWLAVITSLAVVSLLSLKKELLSQINGLKHYEIIDTLKFLVISLIIYPLLPDKPFAPYNLNPRSIWEVVVVVSLISFSAYILIKKFGTRHGLNFSAFFGGFISGNAATISFAKLCKNDDVCSHALSLRAALLAASVTHIRIALFLFIFNHSLFYLLWWKLLVYFIAGILLCTLLQNKENFPKVLPKFHPLELRTALNFALIFTIISILIEHFKSSADQLGMFILSIFSGMTSSTPFILSVSKEFTLASPEIGKYILFTLTVSTAMKGIYFYLFNHQNGKKTFIFYFSWIIVQIGAIFV